MAAHVAAPSREMAVWQWLGAFNDHDLDALLACMASDVVFQPLRLAGGTRSYDGHVGVRRWYRELCHVQPGLRIAVTSIQETGSGQVLAEGALGLEGFPEDDTPFCAMHSVVDGQIVAARHYLTDAPLLEWLGRVR